MKIQPVSSPHAIQPSNTTSSNTAQTARAAAIAKLTQAPQTVQNQNAILPEEMGAVIPKPNLRAVEPEETQEVISEEAPNPGTERQSLETKQEQEDSEISRRFAQLARQEKALRQQRQQHEQAIKAREQALASREAELTAKDSKYATGYYQKDQIKQNALQVLADAGVSYEELTQQILNQPASDPRMEATVNTLRQQIEELKQANENSRKAVVEQQTQAYQAAVKQIAADAKKLVYTDPNFETVKATNSVSDVVELITRTYEKDGVVLSVEDAAQQVEDYLIEEAMKITRIEKIKKRLSQNAQSTKSTSTSMQQQTAKQPEQQQPMKTLTNANTSSRKLSAKERAILRFKGESF